jgi:hypothetical protein
MMQKTLEVGLDLDLELDLDLGPQVLCRIEKRGLEGG